MIADQRNDKRRSSASAVAQLGSCTGSNLPGASLPPAKICVASLQARSLVLSHVQNSTFLFGLLSAPSTCSHLLAVCPDILRITLSSVARLGSCTKEYTPRRLAPCVRVLLVSQGSFLPRYASDNGVIGRQRSVTYERVSSLRVFLPAPACASHADRSLFSSRLLAVMFYALHLFKTAFCSLPSMFSLVSSFKFQVSIPRAVPLPQAQQTGAFNSRVNSRVYSRVFLVPRNRKSKIKDQKIKELSFFFSRFASSPLCLFAVHRVSFIISKRDRYAA